MAFGTAKGWSLAGLDRWSSYRGAFVYKMHRDLINVELLDRWSSYRGRALDRFDCNPKTADTELTAISVDNYAGTVIR